MYSFLNVQPRDTLLTVYPGFTMQGMPNSKKTPALAAAAKAEREPIFARLIEAPTGFDLVGDDEFMYSFHAEVDPSNGTLMAFGKSE